MRHVLSPIASVEIAGRYGPTAIAVGLAALVVAMIWPAVPAVTAMAVVALGATGVTTARFRAAPALVPTLLLHLAVYTGLYALSVGATLHAAATGSAGGVSETQAIDLAISIWPMVFTWWLVISVLQRGGGGEDAPAR